MKASQSEGRAPEREDHEKALIIAVCITCRRTEAPDEVPRAGVKFAADVAAASVGTPFRVMPVRCLAMCKKPAAAAIVQKDSWTYAFSGLDFDTDAPTVIAAAHLLYKSKDGRLPPKPQRPPAVQQALSGRFPPFDFTEDKPVS